jgi:two-component system LytT family sensor kinase
MGCLAIRLQFTSRSWWRRTRTIYYALVRREELEKTELQEALAESELQSLKSQLHPHLLFNTLHGLSTLIETDRGLVRLMILRLSDLLRTTLEHGAADLVSLEKELEFARAYLDLEKMRLDGRLEVHWKIDDGTGRVLVPQLILQPLVENAIVHGVSCSREGGWVEIGCGEPENPSN